MAIYGPVFDLSQRKEDHSTIFEKGGILCREETVELDARSVSCTLQACSDSLQLSLFNHGAKGDLNGVIHVF